MVSRLSYQTFWSIYLVQDIYRIMFLIFEFTHWTRRLNRKNYKDNKAKFSPLIMFSYSSHGLETEHCKPFDH